MIVIRYRTFCKLSGFTVKAMNLLLQKTPNINSKFLVDNKDNEAN